MPDVDKWGARTDETNLCSRTCTEELWQPLALSALGINLVIFNSLIFCCLLNIY